MRIQSAEGTLGNVQQVRVAAPRAVVWRRLGLDDAFFATLPVADVAITDGGRHATFLARVGVGPIALKRRGSASITGTVEREALELVVALDDDSVTLRAHIKLADGDLEETLLTYDTELLLAYRMPRFRHMLSVILDDHVSLLLREVSATSARHWKAERVMRPGPAED